MSRAYLCSLAGFQVTTIGRFWVTAEDDWPGNIRELENAIERAVVMRQGEWILPEDLPEAVIEQSVGLEAEAMGYQEQVVRLKRKLIIDAVKTADGNITAAAEALGLHPNYLHRLIRNLDLRSEIKKNQ